MEIKRDIMSQLVSWKRRDNRRPLILQGARQIGKTWLMKKFGEQEYAHTAYFNFDGAEELKAEFDLLKDPERIIGALRLYTTEPILPEKTLIIFDEIQECPKALNSLKYFQEQYPDYHIIAAGSLLGVSLGHTGGFPVGKVEFLNMYPISFREYLRCDDPQTFDYIENWNCADPIPTIIDNRLKESFDRFCVCGGMPQAACASLSRAGNDEIAKIQKDIILAFQLDFSKHAPKTDIPRISEVWNSLPSQLAKENRKFIYKLVRPGARAREYENSLLWLIHAGLVYRVYCNTKPGLPLSAYDELSAFKLYMFDTGLLRQLAFLPPDIFVSNNPMFTEFKGALAENMILQSIVSLFDTMPRYWVSDGRAEVDFIIQHNLSVTPVEVKASGNVSSKSLQIYISKYSPDTVIIFSQKPFAADGSVLHIPLHLANWTARIIMANKQ